MNYLAKTNPNVSLIDHLNNVANTSMMMASKVTDDNDLQILSYITGKLHDIGKCTESFQNHLNNDKVDYASHNMAGFLLLSSLVDSITINSVSVLETVKNVVLYHHPMNNDESYKLITENDVTNAYNLIKDILNEAKVKFNKKVKFSMKSFDDEEEVIDGFSSVQIPYYLTKSNTLSFFARNVVNPADVITSHWEKDSSKTLEEYFEIEMNRKNSDNVQLCKPNDYDERFDIQKGIVSDMISKNHTINMFDSQTGFGKTMLGLMFLLMDTKKKGYWVCPQNSIARSVYQTIVKEIYHMGLNKTINVGLLLTGKFIHGGEDSDIIVTNIDNMFRPVIKSENSTLYRSYQLLYGNCVFDEYHDYVSESSIMAAFDLICNTRNKCKKVGEQSRMLLLSATTVPFLKKKYIKDDSAFYCYNNDKMLDRKIHLSFVDTFDGNLNGKNYFYCTNAVKTAQNIMSNGVVDNIIHAQYIQSYKDERYDLLMSTHGKDNQDNSSWVCTSVASTGVDISFNNGVFTNITPDRFLQSLGRIDRWQKYDGVPDIIVVKDEKNKSEKCALETISNNASNTMSFSIISGMFYDFLVGRFGNDSIVTFRDLYKARQDFYEINDNALHDFYKKILIESDRNISKITFSYSNVSDDESDTVHISKKANLRSNGTDKKYFIKLKDDETNEFIDELYQIDDITLKPTKLDDSFWADALSLSKKNKYQKRYIGNSGKIKEKLLDMANCSETPLMMVRNLYHNSILGIVDKR